MLLMFLSILALYGGLLLMPLLRQHLRWVAALDGFVVVTVGGLVLIHLIPHSVRLGGMWSLAAAALGVILPGILERGLSSRGAASGRWIAAITLVGIALHAFLDGTALASPEASHGGGDEDAHVEDLLALGVLLHRLPVGLLMGLQLLPLLGWGRTLGVASLMAVGTVVGFGVGLESLEALPVRELGIFQGLVAGMLLHIIFQHAPSGLSGKGYVKVSAVGGLAGGGALLWIGHEHPIALHCAQEVPASLTFMTLVFESAPALLLAFGGAGLLRAFIRPQTLGWLGRGSTLTQSAKGLAFGLPLPICSCGVLPLYETLIRSGVPAAAATAFLVATPELGIDAFLLSLPLLGGEMAVARVIAAAVAALVVSLVVSRWISASHPPAEGNLPVPKASAKERAQEALRYGFVELFDHTVPWILVGLLVASLVEPALHSDQLATGFAGLDVPLMALVGIPAYVCASGATPLVAVLMHKGLSAGAAIAFLLTGPATNATSFGVLMRLHGRRVAVGFGVLMFVVACALGYLTNAVMPSAAEIALHDAATDAPSALQIVCAAVLGLLLLASWLRRGPRGWVSDLSPHKPTQRPTHSHHNHPQDHTHSHPETCPHGCAHNH